MKILAPGVVLLNSRGHWHFSCPDTMLGPGCRDSAGFGRRAQRSQASTELEASFPLAGLSVRKHCGGHWGKAVSIYLDTDPMSYNRGLPGESAAAMGATSLLLLEMQVHAAH